MAEVILSLKTCMKCGSTKPAAEFHKYSRSRDGLRSRCKPCRSEESSEYHAKNPGKSATQGAKYYANNREKVKARTAAYQRANPEVQSRAKKKYRAANRDKEAASNLKWRLENAERRAQYRRDNRESFSEYNRRYRSENKDWTSEYGKRWKQENRDACNASWMNRKARKLAAGTHTVAEIQSLLAAQKYRCANCEDSIFETDRHLDHWMPLSKGGSNKLFNLQWLCVTCNLRKGSTDPIDWLARLGKASHWPRTR